MDEEQEQDISEAMLASFLPTELLAPPYTIQQVDQQAQENETPPRRRRTPSRNASKSASQKLKQLGKAIGMNLTHSFLDSQSSPTPDSDKKTPKRTSKRKAKIGTPTQPSESDATPTKKRYNKKIKDENQTYLTHLNLQHVLYPNIQILEKNIIAITREEAYEKIPLFHSSPLRFSLKSDEILEIPVLEGAQIEQNHYVFHSGASVWGLDWCPNVPDEDGYHYLAVAGFLGDKDEHHRLGEKLTGRTGCVQIWSIPRSQLIPDQESKPVLEACFLHDFGRILQMKWHPCNETTTGYKKELDESPFITRLGFLAACFGDGATRLFAIPHPHHLRKSPAGETSLPHFVLLNPPLLSLISVECSHICFSWSLNGLIAAGGCNGNISIWNAEEYLKKTDEGMPNEESPDPLVTFHAHNGAVRCVDWCKLQTNKFGSAGNDGRLLFWDLQDICFPTSFFRIRAFQVMVSFPYFHQIIIYSDVGHVLRGSETTESNKGIWIGLFKGTIWSVDSFMYHPTTLAVSQDGTCKYINLQRFNTFRTARKETFKTQFQMLYDPNSNVISYIGANEKQEIEIVTHKKEQNTVERYPEEVAQQRVACNNNHDLNALFATGSQNGTVRISIVIK